MATPLDAAVGRLRGCMNAVQGSRIAVEPADVGAVLAALERLLPAARPPRKDLVSMFEDAEGRPAAHCPDCRTPAGGMFRMRCLSTRRPEPGMVRRRWECSRCKERFTSYTHEKE